ncbi:hypothetical protein [Alkaliphilus metalliredigens]|uniref:hypothetical protein n=1 Tax=Alkaliphilus metalliredigens TaxID=208226 RepID=UPI0012EE30F7|nr:hypothetical protein [Alkaliphilus metalliredigens]
MRQIVALLKTMAYQTPLEPQSVYLPKRRIMGIRSPQSLVISKNMAYMVCPDPKFCPMMVASAVPMPMVKAAKVPSP